MKTGTKYLSLLLASALTAFLITSCREGDPAVLEKENLFSLRYGKADDSIYFSGSRSLNMLNPASVKMVNGIFYIMNSDLKKVMKFNSYGDLLSIVGSRDTVSDTILVQEKTDENSVINRRAVFFPFSSIKNIEVDGRQYLYVTDILPESRHEWDEENSALLSDTVYIFDNNFGYIDTLGRDGIGGEPFPYILQVKTNSLNDVVVISRNQESYFIHWFNSGWELLYNVELDSESVPYPAAAEDLIASIDSIRIPAESRSLFIKFDYYKETLSDAAGGISDIGFYKSYVQMLDLQSGRYVNAVEIPDVFTVSTDPHNFADERRQLIYDFLDIGAGNTLYLSAIINNRSQQLTVLDPDGRILANTRLGIDFRNYHHIDFNLSREGIISALLAGTSNISVVWWRTDRILRDRT